MMTKDWCQLLEARWWWSDIGVNDAGTNNQAIWQIYLNFRDFPLFCDNITPNRIIQVFFCQLSRVTGTIFWEKPPLVVRWCKGGGLKGLKAKGAKASLHFSYEDIPYAMFFLLGCLTTVGVQLSPELTSCLAKWHTILHRVWQGGTSIKDKGSQLEG